MKPDGTDQRKLLEEKNGIMSPRWSPSGDAIYYFRMQGGTAELVRFTVSGPSRESAVVASGLQPGDYFTLSADGLHLVYTREQSYSNLWLAELPAPGATAGVQQKQPTSGTLSYKFSQSLPGRPLVDLYDQFDHQQQRIQNECRGRTAGPTDLF